MRSMGSGDAFHRAYTNATQQAFLEGTNMPSPILKAYSETLRYDNLTTG